MKTILFSMVIILFVSGISFSQDMKPKPISSPMLKALEGTWISDPYEFMGAKMTDEAVHKMILNSQFLEVSIKSTGDNGFVYEGLGIIAPSEDGTFTGWFYDIYGKDGIMTYTGKEDNGKLIMTGSNNFMDEKREISIEDNKIVHNIVIEMKYPGADKTQQKLTVTYKKRN